MTFRLRKISQFSHDYVALILQIYYLVDLGVEKVLKNNNLSVKFFCRCKKVIVLIIVKLFFVCILCTVDLQT